MACAAQASPRVLALSDKMERPLLIPCRPRASSFPLASSLKRLPMGRPGAARCSASSQGKAQPDSSSGTLQERPKGSALASESPRPTSLDPWDPFNWSTRSLRQTMDALDMVFGDVPGPNMNVAPFTRTPWDVVESDGGYELRIDLPGFEKDEVKVYLDDGVLIVNAESKKEQSDHEKKGKRSMRTRGSYRTKIALPKNCDTSKINAKLHNGVLEVHIPHRKTPEHVIDVKVE